MFMFELYITKVGFLVMVLDRFIFIVSETIQRCNVLCIHQVFRWVGRCRSTCQFSETNFA